MTENATKGDQQSADSGLQRLPRATLRDEASRALRMEIATGKLEPRLYAFGEIAGLLGVSITPVREALLELANDGLVDIVRNRGFRVRAISEHDLDELLELRHMLEVPMVGQIAASDEPLGNLAELRELAAETVRTAAAGDLGAYLDTDRAFHLSLLAAGGNARLVDIVGKLRDQTRLYGLGELVGTDLLVETTKEHDLILDAVEAGDEKLATELLARHLRHTRGIWAGQKEAP